MGMFDSVIVQCANCNGLLEFQSKQGACLLEQFLINNVPPEIARDIEGHIEICELCGCENEILISKPIYNVKMEIRQVER